MVDAAPSPDRNAAIEAFAARLNALRLAAGRPSFRAMAQRSGCISHTTLYEATRGHRLPSWETTEQFVLSCGGDPGPWRITWAQAAAIVDGGDQRTAPESPALPSADSPVGPSPATEAVDESTVTAMSSQIETPASPASPTDQRIREGSARPSPQAVSPTESAAGPQSPVSSPLRESAASAAGPRAVLPGHAAPGGAPSDADVLAPTAEASPTTASSAAEPTPPVQGRRRGLALAATAGLLVGCVIGYGAAALTMPASSPPAASVSPSGPAGLGDGAASDGGGPSDVAGQLTDLSYPDETRVKAGATIDKAWGLSNAGGVTWEGRRLVRITPADSGGARCSTPSEVPIPETAPGTAAEIHVPITMPDKADVSCRVEWKMVNKDGSESFPNSRPIYFLLFTER